jgi:hypothetical protein
MMTFKDFCEVISTDQSDPQFTPIFNRDHRIGEIKPYDIHHYQQNGYNYYAMVGDDYKTLSWIVTRPSRNMEQIVRVDTLPEYQRRHLVENLLLWLKSYLNKSFISDDHMSLSAIEWRKYLSKTGRFKQYWLNTKTGDRHEYDPNVDHPELSPYRIKNPVDTNWRLVIEGSDGKHFWESWGIAHSLNLDMFGSEKEEPPLIKG